MGPFKVRPGSRYPAGARADSEGVNFCIFSQHATGAELLLYENPTSKIPFQIVILNREDNWTFFFWHVYVQDLRPGVSYTWRIDGPNDTQQSGCRFNKNIELLDPWARGVTDVLWDRRQAVETTNRSIPSIRAIVVADEKYDWEGDKPLNPTHENCIIYELHVGGFTRHPTSNVKNPGTFSAIIEKIPYLKDLGITVIELLPVMAFDEQDIPDQGYDQGLKNYWGYSTHSFYSTHPGYSSSPLQGDHREEFRNMVKALHRAGIAVILDVVFNHTAEAGADGPTINFKGFGNHGFYHLDPEDGRIYRDYTGCGNTVNCNHPLVTTFIVECLEYWVREMHVDGFRFDLASVLVRGEDGEPMHHAPVVWSIEFADTLAKSKLIAEAWDARGLYQVGGFPGFRWHEWNGKYRDVVRRFIRGDEGLIGEVATRITGSSDLYQPNGRLPINSVNFITCHDGFSLYDLVSYNEKNNHANGENNRDGTNDNYSWNCGMEGKTEDMDIEILRRRQAKNFMVVLFLSQGIPMILSGDEVLRTQCGNNNSYCQDNELSWFDWKLAEENAGMLRFTKEIICFRKRHPTLNRKNYLSGNQKEGRIIPDISWHGCVLNEPLWTQDTSQILAFTLDGLATNEEPLHVMLNMSESKIEMQLPQFTGKAWFRAIDTWLSSPNDIVDPSNQILASNDTYEVQPRSIVVVECRPTTNY